MHIDEFLATHPPKIRPSRITPHHAEVMRLRELEYSYAAITKYLASVGVDVTIPTVRAYVMRHSETPAPTPPAPAKPRDEGKGVVAATPAPPASIPVTQTYKERGREVTSEFFKEPTNLLLNKGAAK